MPKLHFVLFHSQYPNPSSSVRNWPRRIPSHSSTCASSPVLRRASSVSSPASNYRPDPQVPWMCLLVYCDSLTVFHNRETASRRLHTGKPLIANGLSRSIVQNYVQFYTCSFIIRLESTSCDGG